MKKKRKLPAKSETSPHGNRPSWSGNLRFGLVNFAVQAFNAREPAHVPFHQLHATCHRRIHYEKRCPVHGEVENDEIVSGYEYARNKYVELDPSELDALRTERERALTIDTFVKPEQIDPLMFEGRAYYLVPDGAGAGVPYAVFVQALRKHDRYGVGQVAFSSREHLVVVRPYQSSLVMQVLSYAAELRPPREVAGTVPKSGAREVALAEQLIDQWTAKDFDLAQYVDPYRERLQELVDAKIKGREVVAPEEEEQPRVINLVEALRKSVSQGHQSASGSKAGSSSATGSRRGGRSKRKRAG